MEKEYFYNALKRYEKGWSEVKLLMDQNESEYGSMLLLLYPRYSCDYSYVWFGCSARTLMNHFWSRHACSLSIKEAIQSMLGFTYTLTEPSQEKNNDLHMRKQTRRSAVQ